MIISKLAPGCSTKSCLPIRVRITRLGSFFEFWNRARWRDHGLDFEVVQSYVSESARGVLRGLHFQWPYPQGKLVGVLQGEVYDVAVDILRCSPDFGRWTAATLTGDNFHQLYVPPGCAHGFCVLSDRAQVQYKVTELYDPKDEMGIAYNDPELSIAWPVTEPLLSDRDKRNERLATVAERIGLRVPAWFKTETPRPVNVER